MQTRRRGEGIIATYKERDASTNNVRMNNWKTYILRCHDNSLYTGVTTDIERRVKEHNAGTGAKYTRSRLPCSLAWLKEGFTESEAKKEPLDGG